MFQIALNPTTRLFSLLYLHSNFANFCRLSNAPGTSHETSAIFWPTFWVPFFVTRLWVDIFWPLHCVPESGRSFRGRLALKLVPLCARFCFCHTLEF